MPLLRKKHVEQELLDYLPARGEGLRILYHQGPHIVVEVPPQRFLTHLGSAGSAVEFPMPWSAYFIDLDVMNIGNSKRDLPAHYARYAVEVQSRMCSVFGLDGPAGEPNETQLLYLPLPNFYSHSLTFCGNQGRPVPGNSPEHAAALAISDFWAGGFRYYRPDGGGAYKEVWNNLSKASILLRSVSHNWSVYNKWLKSSPEELCQYPFGRHSIGTLAERLSSTYAFYESYT